MTPAVRHALPADRAALTHFLNLYWGSRHPLVNNPVLFQFYYDGEDTLRFCLAEDENGIAAACGYIPASEGAGADVWASVFCARPGAVGAGLSLMAAMPALTGCRVLACNNIRPETLKLYHFLGYTAARMPHYYRLAGQGPYKLAVAQNPVVLPVKSDLALELCSTFDAVAARFTPPAQACPYKDLWYIHRRYFAYPFPGQEYLVYGVPGPGGRYAALLVARVIPAAGTRVLRIVDFIGPPDIVARLGGAIQGLMTHFSVEYADFYAFGFGDDRMAQAGFLPRLPGDGVVIPNYLTPVLRENTEYYFFTSDATAFTMCKADGDQDRPNLG